MTPLMLRIQKSRQRAGLPPLAKSEPIERRIDEKWQEALFSDPVLREAFFDEKHFMGDIFFAYLQGAKPHGKGVSLWWPGKHSIAESESRVGFVGFQRFSPSGQVSPSTLLRDADGAIADNLIIKGENLSTLRALRHAFQKKIKLLYIDPPYGTGTGAFQYDDRFGSAKWLSFMKNRLEAVQPLLQNDAMVIVQCSFHHQACLETLMKELFRRHLCTIHVQVRHPDRVLTGDKNFNDVMEHILIFSQNTAAKMPKRLSPKTNADYVHQIETLRVSELLEIDGRSVEVYHPGDYLLRKGPASANGLKKISIRGTIREKNNSGRIFVRSLEPLNSRYPPMTLFKYPGIGADGLGYRFFYSPGAHLKSGKRRKNGGYFQGKPVSATHTEKPHPNYFNFVESYNRVRSEGGVDLRNGKKPEKLMRLLIEMFTEPGDRVLDYHLGSGTTCAVAHKLGRRYIGIEQLDYVEEKAVKRLKGVIGFLGAPTDVTGITDAVGWNGGGSFVYCELKHGGTNAFLGSDSRLSSCLLHSNGDAT